MSGTSWRSAAACRDVDPGLFFGPDGEDKAARLEREAAAKAVCRACSAIAPCLDFAVRNAIPVGVYGGMTEKERRAVSAVQVTRLCSEYLHVLPEGALRCKPCSNARERALRAAQRQEVAA